MTTNGRLDGKVVLITGSGAGFGRGITKKFVAEGARVLAIDINEKSARETAAAAPKGTVVALKGDVSSEADWRRALRTVLETFGDLHVVVCWTQVDWSYS